MRRRPLLILAAALTLFGAAAAAYLFSGKSVPELAITDIPGDPARGAYVARMAGCIACHTDRAGGGALLAGGPELRSPFGSFRAPNITPDRESGIGGWTLNDFARALRHGVSPRGRPYYPAFPYPFYARMTDRDVADLWTALRTVPPVPQKAKPHELAFPFDQRWTLNAWQVLFFEPRPFTPDPGRDENWNRGRYIVTGAAHCGACHTPRNSLGVRAANRRFHGSDLKPGGEKVPPITASALRKRRWTEPNLAFGLRYGAVPNGDVLGGSMGEVIWDGTAWLTEDDRRAVAAFLMAPDPAKTGDAAPAGR